MATITQSYKPHAFHIVLARRLDTLVERLMPRRRTVISVGMILAGLGIPALMAFNVLPVSFLLGFVGFALVAVGGVLALVFCGEL